MPRICVAEMCILRWMRGNTRRDKVRNKDIRTKIGVASIEEKMRENRLRWYIMGVCSCIVWDLMYRCLYVAECLGLYM